MKISKSKRQLAQLLIEAGVTKYPEGANWAAQDQNAVVTFFADEPWRCDKCWEASQFEAIDSVTMQPKAIPNWHQTVLSRDEFDQIVAETVVGEQKAPSEKTKAALTEAVGPAPTLDQLLCDWRNADDYARRKQTEADEAAAMRDERWRAAQARAGEMGVTVGLCGSVEVEQELVVTSWKDVRRGDYVWIGDSELSHNNNCPSGEYEVMEVDTRDSSQPFRVKWEGRVAWPNLDCRGWHFIRRP